MALTLGQLRLIINSIALEPDPAAAHRRIDDLYRTVLAEVVVGHPQSRELAAEVLQAQRNKFDLRERTPNGSQDQRHVQERRASA